MVHFQSSFLLTCQGKQQRMAQGLEPLHSHRSPERSSCSWLNRSSSSCGGHLRSEPVDRRLINRLISWSLSHSAFHMKQGKLEETKKLKSLDTEKKSMLFFFVTWFPGTFVYFLCVLWWSTATRVIQWKQLLWTSMEFGAVVQNRIT